MFWSKIGNDDEFSKFRNSRYCNVGEILNHIKLKSKYDIIKFNPDWIRKLAVEINEKANENHRKYSREDSLARFKRNEYQRKKEILKNY